MGIKLIAIELESGGTFAPGDMLVGVLVLQIGGRRPHELSRVEVKLRGLALTNWISNGISGPKTHFAIEHLVRHEIVVSKLLAGRDQDGKLSVPPGHYQLPFSVQLPHDVPPSVIFSKGMIVYTIKGRAISPGIFSFNGKTNFPFYVKSHLDLNENCNLRQELVLSGPWGKQPQNTDPSAARYCVTMLKRGFIPGETIHIYIDGPETLFERLGCLRAGVKLKQITVFRTSKAVKEKKETLVQLSPSDWRHVQMVVPANTLISMHGHCNIIRVRHYVKITAPLELRLLVVIGTVPLRN